MSNALCQSVAAALYSAAQSYAETSVTSYQINYVVFQHAMSEFRKKESVSKTAIDRAINFTAAKLSIENAYP